MLCFLWFVKVWRLVQLICRGRSTSESLHDNIEDFSKQQNVITRILTSLDQWNIRVAWLGLQVCHYWKYSQNTIPKVLPLKIYFRNIPKAIPSNVHSCTFKCKSCTCICICNELVCYITSNLMLVIFFTWIDDDMYMQDVWKLIDMFMASGNNYAISHE